MTNRHLRAALRAAALFLLLATLAPTARAAQADEGRAGPAAPDFTGADGWLNTDKPIAMKDLKGHVVLLDFWTYCCINCMHVFPDLKYLEEKYKDQPFVVVGVHSGKFDHEKDAQQIRNAVLRHNIDHPVAVDSDYKVWNTYGVRAWPTLVLIDPEGKVLGALSGEGHRDVLDKVIGQVLEEHKAKGTLADKPLTFKRERETFKSGTLEFPGKVLADAAGKRLFIADTNHHRILVTDLDGRATDVIGQSAIGMKDGTFEAAQFHQPQGMALSEDGRTLYIADTENHAVRAADLDRRTVTTIAGTGKQSYERRPKGPGPETALSSPWDVARVGRTLFIAMAGTHQVWKLDLGTGVVTLHAGSGPESAEDGPNLEATFSQPSGFATDGKVLYVADSESSTIRTVEAKDGGETTSVAGSNHLFGFGQTDGKGKDARFQHPLGVALDGQGALFVADSFNNTIRRIDLTTGEVTTWLGTGKPDPGDESAIGFYEPGGISIAGGTLYVADTNHHRIVAVDIASKKARVLDVQLPAAPK
jgi:sugar lactone lactonase YvrE/thiol-disulfide isomerase/thioredoxin